MFLGAAIFFVFSVENRVKRGRALTLADPAAKLIALPVEQRVAESVKNYDKVFFVNTYDDLYLLWL